MAFFVLADIIRPVNRTRARARDICLVTGFSLLIALSAQVAIPLPFTPVPVTLQTLAVFLAGALLGSRRGLTTVLLYIGEGLAGLPVFAGGGAGIGHLVGPTGGYLLGFLPAAFFIGCAVERGWARRPLSLLAALVIGNACIYVPGLSWLGVYVGLPHIVSLGLAPFLAGDLLKITAGLGVISAVTLALSQAESGQYSMKRE
jgi:biotin transport system substrate-specific component